MGDRVSASITIGGRLPKSLIPALLEAIEAEGLGLDYGEPGPTAEDIVSGEQLFLADDEVNYGMFETLEAFCLEHDLPFRSCADGYSGSFDPEVRILRPGAGEVKHYDATEDGNPVLTLADLQRLGSYEAAVEFLEAGDWQPPALEVVDG